MPGDGTATNETRSRSAQPQRLGTQQRKPDWLKIRMQLNAEFKRVRRLMQDLSLNTVCEEAACPNIHECWGRGTATFMILGEICTRACGFCAVNSGLPNELDLAEPERLAEAVDHLGLKHVVITSVARDDLHDGGASIFAESIRAIHRRCPEVDIEVLIPDLLGDWQALFTIIDAGPVILNHNLETVRRLSPRVRTRAKHDRSLELLRQAKRYAQAKGYRLLTKSGIMVGLGERWEEIEETMHELNEVGCDIMTIGQYLRPSLDHLPVEKYWTPEEFRQMKAMGEAIGIPHVEAGPLVRSSYHADEQAKQLSPRPLAGA